MPGSKSSSRIKPGASSKPRRQPASDTRSPRDYVTITVPELPQHGEADA